MHDANMGTLQFLRLDIYLYVLHSSPHASN